MGLTGTSGRQSFWRFSNEPWPCRLTL